MALRVKEVQQYNNFASFPLVANAVKEVIYIDAATNDIYRFDGTIYVLISAGVDVFAYATFAGFPVTGVEPKIYIDKATGNFYYWNATSLSYVGLGRKFIFTLTGTGVLTTFTSASHGFGNALPTGRIAMVQTAANTWEEAVVGGIKHDTTASTITVEFSIAPPLAEVWRIAFTY